MKKPPWYAWITASGIFLALLDVFAYGGVVQRQVVGEAVTAQARREAPLAHTYIVLGRDIVEGRPALSAPAVTLADTAWQAAYPAIVADPTDALDDLHDRGKGPIHAFLGFSYWAAPIFFLIALGGWLFRPKTVRLMGSRR